jgi:hypothetical protein
MEAGLRETPAVGAMFVACGMCCCRFHACPPRVASNSGFIN